MDYLPRLVVLDVGHGNCAVLQDTRSVTVIDCAPGATLIKLLEELEITEIGHVFISHADRDHCGGLSLLLTNNRGIHIQNLYVNPGGQKKTKTWDDVCVSVEVAKADGRIGNIEVGLTSELSNDFHSGEVDIAVLAPAPTMAMKGVGDKYKGRTVNANTLSAVISLMHSSHRVVLFAGDIDNVGLDDLLDKHEASNLEADILVFPHHGGKPGNADAKQFAKRLCEFVKPKLVIFSVDRNKDPFPRKEIVEGVKSAVPDIHIWCTQLSKKCCTQLSDSELSHVVRLPAKGKAERLCCGGTFSTIVRGNRTLPANLLSRHARFIGANVSRPMCSPTVSQ